MPPDKLDIMQGYLVDLRGELRADIAEIKDELRTLREQHAQTREIVAALKVKAGVWGAIAGLIPAIIAAVWVIVEKVKP